MAKTPRLGIPEAEFRANLEGTAKYIAEQLAREDLSGYVDQAKVLREIRDWVNCWLYEADQIGLGKVEV